MVITKKDYKVSTENGIVTFERKGKKFFSVPAAATVNNVASNLSLKSENEDKIVFESENEKMFFHLYDDFALVE